jgi:hypothetical protein
VHEEGLIDFRMGGRERRIECAMHKNKEAVSSRFAFFLLYWHCCYGKRRTIESYP